MANEKRLIDANALQIELDPWGGMNGVICLGRSGGKTMATVQAALKCMIDNAPTVDAVEVVHAHWEMGVDEGDYEYGTCSVCGYNEYNAFGCLLSHNYCPNCGAKMDGGNEDV